MSNTYKKVVPLVCCGGVVLLIMIYYSPIVNDVSPAILSTYNNSREYSKRWFASYVSDLEPLQIRPRNDSKLCIKGQGRLGNNMFQFAAAYSLARHLDKKLVIDSGMANMLSPVFTMKLPSNNHVYDIGQCSAETDLYQYKTRGFRQKFLTIVNDDSLRVKSYFASWRYFQHNAADIRQLFSIKQTILDRADRIIHQLANVTALNLANTTLIGIHVRRGDVAAQEIVPSVSYFRNAMLYFRQRFDNVHFFVASNDQDWCNRNLVNERNVSMLRGSKEEDMAVLTRCDHTIMSVGTFGWWSGWLANGQVVYFNVPNRLVKPNELYRDENFFLPYWIPIAA